MASKAKKAKTVLPECPYGAKCYRKNPQHHKDFSHNLPGLDDAPSTSSSTGDGVARLSTSLSSSALTPCKYGAKCYRKNLMHFAEFSHPTKKDDDGSDHSGSDTDVMEDDEDEKKDEKKNGDILSRGMSLVKSYSQMSESERKELIKKAFEAKKQLQEELEATKKKVVEKEKEVENLQSQVNTGLLLVEGEEEALKGDKMKIFTLEAERAYKEGSAAQIHFRLAESQFYRLLSGTASRITKVEYVVNPELVKRFKKAREDLKKSRGEDFSYPVLAFHGTQEKNITPICEKGFKSPGESGFKMRTDTGWYGAGVYFSEYPAYSMGYIQGATKLLLCQVLPGKAFQCTKLIHGSNLQKGYDSHTSPCKKELVIFNSHRILPSYIVHYANSSHGADFKYTSTGDSDITVDEKFKKAQLAPSSNIFKGEKIIFSGKFSCKQADMLKLVQNHGAAGKATLSNFTMLVTTKDELENYTKKVEEAIENDVDLLSEEYIYDCILKKKIVEVEDHHYIE
ncbi:uncharacterized protein LOC126831981 [Patella vulgata]|uniref:uncharacterized protein LOC126831981 n=1 Tax=Patella vulgata TaxID=6465 RepID=UPI0024A81149|nr:uncharacterized protein LOC126831981 [Patella vulgata]